MTTDRRTARNRSRAVTTSLAVAGALGVAGVAGGLALQSASGTTTSTTSVGETSRGVSHSHRPGSDGSGTRGGVTSGTGPAHAQSSGS